MSPMILVTAEEMRALDAATIQGIGVPGAVLMEIVPEDDTLVVEARLQPLDVTHVHPGLPAEVRKPVKIAGSADGSSNFTRRVSRLAP